MDSLVLGGDDSGLSVISPPFQTFQEPMSELCRLAGMVRLFLERSKDTPLTFALSVFGEDKPEIPEFLSLLVESADRWKHVDLDASDFPHLIFRPLSRRPSSLTSLRLYWSSRDVLSQPIGLFENCKALTCVRLRNDAVFFQWSLLRLPWEQLTRLEVCIDSRLKDLELVGCGYFESEPPPTAPITLPHLENLHMPKCTDIPFTLLSPTAFNLGFRTGTIHARSKTSMEGGPTDYSILLSPVQSKHEVSMVQQDGFGCV
ncbi:hypothetical protein V5O48_016220 [Marasmius crinis-equi]|uniref:Uncharacterized protein n=1 Tax=Marasmius crinis-equi TaxID=585013 RepID=A0ABR3ESE0_9AGAR